MPPRALAISAPMPLCVAVFAPCGLLLPLFFLFCFVSSVAHSVFCLPRICGATRLSLAGLFYFIFLFHFLIYFISHLRPPVVVAFGHPLPFMVFSIPWRF
jgi:hypothetical protein